VGPVQHDCEWGAGAGAGAPTTGERCFLEWPDLQAETSPRVVEAFAQAFPDRLHSVRLDHRGAPTARRLRWPAQVRAVWVPPCGPELNPIARVWRDLKDDLAWQQCPSVDAPQDHVSPLWQAYDAPRLPSLTGDAYLVAAIHALGS
jgi:hypothetical protein